MKKITKNKTYFFVTNALRFFVVFAIVASILEQDWFTLFIGVLTLLLTFLPYFIEKNYKIYLPIEFEFAIIIFLYIALFLGEIEEYFLKYAWWDIVAHGSSALALGFIGFMILYVLYKGEKIKSNPFFIAFFSFSFALAVGSLWEIFEFCIDVFFKANMQKSQLDTMKDLIVDSTGALIASLTGYLYLKKSKISFLDKIVKEFEEKNPRLFEKEKRHKSHTQK